MAAIMLAAAIVAMLGLRPGVQEQPAAAGEGALVEGVPDGLAVGAEIKPAAQP